MICSISLALCLLCRRSTVGDAARHVSTMVCIYCVFLVFLYPANSLFSLSYLFLFREGKRRGKQCFFLLPCSCLARALLMPCSCLARALLILCSYFAYTLLMLFCSIFFSFLSQKVYPYFHKRDGKTRVAIFRTLRSLDGK